MRVSRAVLLGFTLILASVSALARAVAMSAEAPLTADAIMARVAGNQDRAEAERGHYVYVQHARVISRKGGTVMCEEVTDSRITPTASGSHADLLKLEGRLLVKHAYVPYTALPGAKHDDGSKVENDHESVSVVLGEEDTDRDLVESMRSSLTDEKSKDGINQRLFPLTSAGQGEYLFHLVGQERMNGRDVFHIDFRPKDKSEFGWKGDAYIDATAYQPVVVSTAMARKVPMAVRTLLGTNVPGLGFTIVYAPQPDGVWLPVSLGTEFKLHVLFFFSRQILINAQNGSFEKTHVRSEMVKVGDPIEPK